MKKKERRKRKVKRKSEKEKEKEMKGKRRGKEGESSSDRSGHGNPIVHQDYLLSNLSASSTKKKRINERKYIFFPFLCFHANFPIITRKFPTNHFVAKKKLFIFRNRKEDDDITGVTNLFERNHKKSKQKIKKKTAKNQKILTSQHGAKEGSNLPIWNTFPVHQVHPCGNRVHQGIWLPHWRSPHWRRGMPASQNIASISSSNAS